MGTFPGTFIPTDAHSSERINFIVDELLTPKMISFRSICIYDEEAELMPDRVNWNVTYGNILEGSNTVVRKNNEILNAGDFTVNYLFGQIDAGANDVAADGHAYDVLHASYTFDYFPVSILAGFIYMSVDIVNTGAQGPTTSYTVEDMPSNWNGVVADLAFAMAMEKLILDYDLWKGRLVFALSTGAMDGDSGDIVGQLETLKSNAEERAYRTLDNEGFKVIPHISTPTQNYYNSIHGPGGCSGRFGGRTRGSKVNRWI